MRQAVAGALRRVTQGYAGAWTVLLVQALMVAAIVAIFCSMAPGQTVAVVLHDGTTLQAAAGGADSRPNALLEVTPEAVVLAPRGAQPLYLAGVAAELPAGVEPYMAAFIGARPLATPEDAPTWTWSFYAPGDAKPTHAKYPLSQTYFCIAPGHKAYWRLNAAGWPNPGLTGAWQTQARTRWGIVGGVTVPPALERIRSFWRIDFGGPQYTLDDWLFKYPAIPITGLHALGRVPEADLDGNHHYGYIDDALQAWLRGTPGAWEAACAMAWRHLQTGVYDDPAAPWYGLHSYEKVDTAKGSTYTGDTTLVPDCGHEWNEGLFLWARLTGDPVALAWADRFARRWPQFAFSSIWNGAGGSRLAGWRLASLNAARAYGFGDAAALDAYRAGLVHWVVTKTAAAGTFWLPNAYTPAGFKPWMDSICLCAALDANPVGPDLDALRAVAEWELDNWVDDQGRVPYEVLDAKAGKANYVYGAEMAAYETALAWRANGWTKGRYQPKLVALRTVAAAGITPNYESNGSAAPKGVAEMIWGLQDRYFR